MFDHITKDVQLAMFASMVRGIVLHYSNHLRLLVTYGAIAESVKTLPRGGQLAQALALITEDDHKAKRPLTTAVVVNAEHEIPGVGFFEQCRTLGYTIDTTPDAECLFWKNQLDRMRVAPFTLEGAIRTRTDVNETVDVMQLANVLSDYDREGVILRRRFVTRAANERSSRLGNVDVSASETARLIRENAVLHNGRARVTTPGNVAHEMTRATLPGHAVSRDVVQAIPEYATTGSPRRRIVENATGNPAPEATPISVKDPASGLPG